MNGYRDDNPQYCYFHPKALVVGICALCLRERLLELASEQDHHGPVSSNKGSSSSRFFRTLSKPPVITLPKVFALGSFLHLLDHSRHPRGKDDHYEDGSAGSLEDSFISIKFEDNGRASWHQKVASVDAAASASAVRNGGSGCPATWGTSGGKEASKSVVEMPKRGAGALRWRKRIGHLLQLARWKRSSKAVALEAGGGGGAGSGKGINRRKGWMRSLTRRRTTTTTFAVSVD